MYMRILQERILEMVAMPFSRGSSQPRVEPRSPTLQADSLLSEPPGKPIYISIHTTHMYVLYIYSFFTFPSIIGYYKIFSVVPCWSLLVTYYIYSAAAAADAKSLQLCPTLCNPIDGSPPGSAVPGILQARTLEWVAISFSNAWKVKSESEVTQSCPTLGNTIDCSLPDSSVHGIFQARVLEWGAICLLHIHSSMYILIQNF